MRTLTAAMDNVDAWRLGEACNAAGGASAGDYIDRGLALRRELEQKGYGIVKLPDLIIHSRYPLSRRLSADQVKRAKKTRDQINEWLRKNGGCELVDFPDDAPDGEET